jgi:hypothetical protein
MVAHIKSFSRKSPLVAVYKDPQPPPDIPRWMEMAKNSWAGISVPPGV